MVCNSNTSCFSGTGDPCSTANCGGTGEICSVSCNSLSSFGITKAGLCVSECQGIVTCITETTANCSFISANCTCPNTTAPTVAPTLAPTNAPTAPTKAPTLAPT